MATDLVINDLLVKGKIGRMPKGGLLDADLVLKGGGTAEGVYRILPAKPEEKNPDGKKPKPGKGPSEGCYPVGRPIDSLHAPTKDAAETEKIRSETKIKLAQARDVASQAGKLSADLARLVKELTHSETDWKNVLHRFFTERAKDTYSYAKPKRRFLADDIYLPGLVGEKLGRVVIAVDCSGSVSEDLLNLFSGEVKALCAETRPSEVEVIYFDHGIKNTEIFPVDTEVVINAKGGGGTAFSPIFEKVNQNEVTPACVVVLTDLQCEDFGPVPDYPVLWASICRRSTPVPFGEITIVKSPKQRGK